MPIPKTFPINAQNSSQHFYSGIEELLKIERNLKKYNASLAFKICQSIKAGGSVLEFGAGIGTLAKIIRDQHLIQVDCIEIDPRLQGEIKRNGFNCYQNTSELKHKYDVIYTSNVLEHIDRDDKALTDLYEKINPNGCLIVYVPAKKFLYSFVDQNLGHFRRYEMIELKRKLETAGFDIVVQEYADILGLFVWLLLKFKKNSLNSPITNDKALIFYDKYVFPISKMLDKILFKKMVGKNIYIVAVKNIS
jgi:SAM-dependent methyltransferase